MRSDIVGMFWDEIPEEKVRKEKIKRTPPERTWESPDFLPHLEEALAFDIPLFTDVQLITAAQKKEVLALDIECYKNYFLITFRSAQSRLVIYFEFQYDNVLDFAKLRWVMDNFTTISFNGIYYDKPMLAIALAGYNTEQLKEASDLIIQTDIRTYQLLKKYKVQTYLCDHIDLREVAPLTGSLKVYSGRLHSRRMQDLPFNPHIVLSPQQIAITRLYCVNDLDNTLDLYLALEKELELRNKITMEYEVDVRSKSDAQIAEAVLTAELQAITKQRIKRPYIPPGTIYHYKIPNFIQYKSPLMNWVLEQVRTAPFIVGENGRVAMPEELLEMSIDMGHSIYNIGIGGLHSTEKTISHHADEKTLLLDVDVESYYPQIILNQLLYPKHLGPNFLKAYRKIVKRRLKAKHDGNKKDSESLKIVINGSFGKLGSKYSILYSPDLLIQVTLTGQLTLLMLIESLELEGIPVVSANTDGIVVKCPNDHRYAIAQALIAEWEEATAFKMEETQYRALYSRDVNNYIALKDDNTIKSKGAYARAGLSKNPTNEICIDALEAYLTKKTPVAQTVKNCKEVSKFVTVRSVKGGAVKDGNFLGKVVRWYYAVEDPETERPEDYRNEIIYAKSGNKVPRSDGARPLMDLPTEVPNDIDYDWYIKETESILVDIGAVELAEKPLPPSDESKESG